eukprot:Gb_38889 [translate_table: standard]
MPHFTTVPALRLVLSPRALLLNIVFRRRKPLLGNQGLLPLHFGCECAKCFFTAVHQHLLLLKQKSLQITEFEICQPLSNGQTRNKALVASRQTPQHRSDQFCIRNLLSNITQLVLDDFDLLKMIHHRSLQFHTV